MNQKLQEYKASISEWFRQQKECMLLCLVSVFAWGLLAHAYGFLHCNLSHDVLNAFSATQTEEIWKIELGRFFVPLYRAILRGPITIPWLIGVLGLIWSAAAVYLVVQIFELRSKGLIVLTAGVMVANVTYTAQIATYVYEFDFNTCALFMAICAVYCWKSDRGIRSVFLGSLFLMVSIGIYQAFFSVAAALMVWKSVVDLFEEKEVKKVFFHGLRGIALLAVGCAAYFLVGKVIYSVTGIRPQNRTDVFSPEGFSEFSFYLSLIKPAFRQLWSAVTMESYCGKAISLIVIAVCGVLSAGAVGVFVRGKYRFGRIALILLLAAAAPFAMLSTYFLAKGKNAHELTIYAYWMFYVFALILAFRFRDSDMLPGWPSKLIKLLCCAAVVIILWQNVVLANTAYIKKEQEADAALSTMTRVVSRLEAREDYSVGETTLAFIGAPDLGDPVPGMEGVSEIIGLGPSNSIPKDASLYYYNAYRAYFDYVLQYPVVLCEDDLHKQLKKDPRVQKMPAFPDAGCIEMIDGVLVIKMGK